MSTASFETIAQAIATRFTAGSITAVNGGPPAGFANVRSSVANPPGAIGPTPAVVTSIDSGEFRTGESTRTGAQSWFVRFYFDQTSDLERTEPALRKWLDVLIYQLKGAVQLAGLVDLCVIRSWRVGVLAYGGVDYTGIELIVHTATSEGWVATS